MNLEIFFYKKNKTGFNYLQISFIIIFETYAYQVSQMG